LIRDGAFDGMPPPRIWINARKRGALWSLPGLARSLGVVRL
jgi:hypothetical protein